jgi:hypothetical protein
MTEKLAAYLRVCSERDIPFAPIVLAFAQSLREMPDLVLYCQDGHPTLNGIYLVACVLYGTIFGKTPIGITNSDMNISPKV